MLPSVPGRLGEFLLPIAPKLAHADEGEASDEAFRILVLSPSMFAVSVVDVTKGKNLPIEGATVTLASRYAEGRSLSAVTDDEGTAIFEIGPLCEGYVDDETPLDEYGFNGGISIRAEGYRDVEMPLVRVEGATAICAPTRLLQDGSPQEEPPYFRELTFDEWDIQYADATFLMPMAENDAEPLEHTFSVQAYLPQGGQADLAVYKVLPAEGGDDERVAELASKTLSCDGGSQLARCELSDTYLDEASGLLEQGCGIRLELRYRGKTYTLDAHMQVATSPLKETTTGDALIIPGDGLDGGFTPLDFPLGFPKIGGSKFTCWYPEFPFIFDMSLMGTVLFGVGAKPKSLKNDKGITDYDGWKKAPRESSDAQAKGFWDDQANKLAAYEKMQSGSDPKLGVFRGGGWSADLSFKVSIQGYMRLAYEWSRILESGEHPWTGSINGLVEAKTDLLWTVQCSAGPIPFFIGFNPWFTFKSGFTCGAITHGSDADFFKNIGFDFNGWGVTLLFQVGIAGTLGLGIAGVASAAIRAATSITTSLAYQQPEGDKAIPRVRLGANTDVDVMIQLVMFKWTSKVYAGNWPSLLDSWKMSDFNSENGYALRKSVLALGDEKPYSFGMPSDASNSSNAVVNMADFIESATIVTEGDMAGRAELKATAIQSAPKLVRNWDEAVRAVNEASDPDSLDASLDSVEHYVHAMVGEEQGVSPLYTYENIGGHRVADTNDAPLGVSGISALDRGGIRPSRDATLFENVLSEAHMKFVTVNGVECLFRIGAVLYEQEGRSRLLVQTKENGVWSDPWPVDFDPGFAEDANDESSTSRLDLFDYDFDVIEYAPASASSQSAYVLVVSGERPSGDDTSFAVASTSAVLSVVRLNIAKGSAPKVVSHTSWRSISGGSRKEAGYHCVQCPRLVVGDRSFAAGHLSGVYLNRTGKSAEQSLGADATVYLEGFAISADDPTGDTLKFRRLTAFNEAPTCIELGEPAYEKTYMIVPVAYECASGCGLYTYAVLLGGGITFWGTVAPDGELQHIVPWRKHEGFLASKGDRINHITWSGKGSSSQLRAAPIGPADCAPIMFGVSANGLCVLYAENTEGIIAQEYDSEDNPVGIEGNIYRIYACSYMNGLFTEPFVLCELERASDEVVTTSSSGSLLSMISSEVVDAQTSSANLRGVEVPLVACATPIGVTPVRGAVTPGSSAETFSVVIRNDGNTLLTAGVIEIYEEGAAEPFSYARIGFDSHNRVASIHDPELHEEASSNSIWSPKYGVDVVGERYADHPLVGEMENAVLAPGSWAQFSVVFSIPQSWEDSVGKRVNVYAKARDLVALDPMTLEEISPGANSELGAILQEYHIPDEDCKRCDVAIGASQASASGLHDAVMTVSGGDGDSGDGGSGSGSGSDAGKGLARTGDAGVPLTAGSLVVAAAAAGAAAYSARRSALEHAAETAATEAADAQ